MKAHQRARYGVPDAAVQAIAAGCDGVLLCSPSQEMQVAALEALIRAAEEGTLPLKRSRTRWRASGA